MFLIRLRFLYILSTQLWNLDTSLPQNQQPTPLPLVHLHTSVQVTPSYCRSHVNTDSKQRQPFLVSEAVNFSQSALVDDFVFCCRRIDFDVVFIIRDFNQVITVVFGQMCNSIFENFVCVHATLL